MPSTRSTQPRWVTEPTMKPTLAPPRHSSTPTCTRDWALADVNPPSKVAAKVAAEAAMTSERRMKENSEIKAVMRAKELAPRRYFYATTFSGAPSKRGPLWRASQSLHKIATFSRDGGGASDHDGGSRPARDRGRRFP